jgi:hypothetical protein
MKTMLRHMAQQLKEDDILNNEQEVHPAIEKTARAISDWHSERDWIYLTDRAKRAIDAISVELNKEGHKEACEYLQRILDSMDFKPKSPDSTKVEEKPRFSTMYF